MLERIFKCCDCERQSEKSNYSKQDKIATSENAINIQQKRALTCPMSSSASSRKHVTFLWSSAEDETFMDLSDNGTEPEFYFQSSDRNAVQTKNGKALSANNFGAFGFDNYLPHLYDDLWSAELFRERKYSIPGFINNHLLGRWMSRALSDQGPSALVVPEEPITLYRLELERLQYIFHFPEEVAFQISATEYKLLYAIQPLDYVRYVSCDLTSVPVQENPSELNSIVKRFSEVSSWITHMIISQPTHEDRKTVLSCILRVIETCWNIGNFNGAVEMLTGLKSEKLRPFWLSLKQDEKELFNSMCEVLLPTSGGLSAQYTEAIQRALRMPQAKVIPFFGTFLRDLYAIVNDVPSIVVIGHQGDRDKLEFVSDYNGEDHYTSRIGVGGLLNMEKIQLVGVVLENLETFHRHYRAERKGSSMNYVTLLVKL